MDGEVDVLGVMDAVGDASASRRLTPAERDSLYEARAAVAELIEADVEYDEALRLANIGYGSTDADRAAQQRLREAVARRRAALAAVRAPAKGDA